MIQEHGSAVLCGLAWVLQGPGSPAVGLPHQRADRDGTKTVFEKKRKNKETKL